MYETELCRLCANAADQTFVEKLFEQNQCNLLQQIEELIGQRLENAEDLPQNICKSCEERTLQAHAFRAQCIRAQHHLALQRKEHHTQQRMCKFKDEAAATKVPIEEVVLNPFHTIKVEKEDDVLSPLPHVGEMLFKHESMNFSNDFRVAMDDSDDSFNPLEEDYHPDDSFNPLEEGYHLNQCMYEKEKNEEEKNEEEKNEQQEEEQKEDIKPVEQKINFFAHAQSLPQENKIDPHIQIKSETKKNKGNRSKRGSNEEKSFICDQCGKNFKVNSLLEAHLRRHTGERKFKCEICPDSFFLNSDLKRHIQKHAGELPHACSHCDRRFLDKSHAKKHERTHTNERPYICQQCGKGFTVSHILKAHMLVHTGERAFSCKLCNAAFKLKKHLVTHYRSMTHKQNEEKYQMNMSLDPRLAIMSLDPRPSVMSLDPRPSVMSLDPRPPVMSLDSKPSVMSLDPRPHVTSLDSKPSVMSLDPSPPVMSLDSKPSVMSLDSRPSVIEVTLI